MYAILALILISVGFQMLATMPIASALAFVGAWWFASKHQEDTFILGVMLIIIIVGVVFWGVTSLLELLGVTH